MTPSHDRARAHYERQAALAKAETALATFKKAGIRFVLIWDSQLVRKYTFAYLPPKKGSNILTFASVLCAPADRPHPTIAKVEAARRLAAAGATLWLPRKLAPRRLFERMCVTKD